MLDVEDGALVVRQMSFRDGTLRIARPTQATEQRYRFADDGIFLGMDETMPLLWRRELTPTP